MVKVSALWLGLILFFKSQASTFFLSKFKPFAKLLINCFLGWEKPALTILKNKSLIFNF